MSTVSRFARVAALACLIAAPAGAEPDPQPGLTDFFSLNRIGTFFANTAIAALRTQMELEYEFLSTDLMRGTVAISGVTARPLLPYDQARQCVITVERAVLNTDVARPLEIVSEMNLNLIGAKANAACLPREGAMALRAVGIREIELDQAKARVAYIYTTGETSTDVSLAINNFAALDFSASGMILPRAGSFGPGDPAFRVMRAVASLKDQGGWQTVSAILPPNFNDPETIKIIGTEGVTEFLSNGGTRTVSAVERNFVTELMARVEEFVSDPGEITVEANLPDTGIVIEPEMYDQEPQALIAALALEARTTPLARTRILSSADLAALQNDAANLSDAQRISLSRALLDGAGVPQSTGAVPPLLDPIAGDNPEAALLMARALRVTDDLGAAYPYALRAAAGGMDTAVALADRFEAQMSTVEVIGIQADVMGEAPATLPEDDDPRSLRRLALAHLSGLNQSRSYARAYYYALLAEAAGDIGATSLKDEIAGRFAARGDAVTDAWQEISLELQQQAIADWVGAGLADRYTTR